MNPWVSIHMLRRCLWKRFHSFLLIHEYQCKCYVGVFEYGFSSDKIDRVLIAGWGTCLLVHTASASAVLNSPSRRQYFCLYVDGCLIVDRVLHIIIFCSWSWPCTLCRSDSIAVIAWCLVQWYVDHSDLALPGTSLHIIARLSNTFVYSTDHVYDRSCCSYTNGMLRRNTFCASTEIFVSSLGISSSRIWRSLY